MRNLTLILGGTKSGKTMWSLNYASRSTRENHETSAISLLVTADPSDPSFQEKIRKHQQEREAFQALTWDVIDAAFTLPQTLARLSQERVKTTLVDDLSVWLANMIHRNPDKTTVWYWSHYCLPLLQTVRAFLSPLIVVSTECSLGIHGTETLSRTYVELLGSLHQALAQRAHARVLIVAGCPIILPKDQYALPID